MKQVVVSDGLRESAVHPRALFDQYVALLGSDIRLLFKDRSDFVAIDCPACQGAATPIFEKLTFAYRTCDECGSTFVSPRPDGTALRRFMEASEAVRFWQSTVEPETKPGRTQSILEPRALWVRSHTADVTPAGPELVDLFSKYPSFLETLAQSGAFRGVMSIEPQVALSSVSPGTVLRVERDLGPALAKGVKADLLSAFECLERASDVDEFMTVAATLLNPDGLLFLTTMTWSGFDLQILAARSRNVLPPVHLNLLSIEGLRRLLERRGFEVVELSTPGQLDVEIVRHAIEDDPAIELPPFVNDLLRSRDEQVHDAFQQFLQGALMSSHLRLVARRARSEASE